MKNEVNGLHDHTGFWLNRLAIAIHQGFVKKLEHFEISIPEWCILITLFHHPKAPMSELADQIVIDRAAISRTVERLVQRGYLIRHVGKDRRYVPLELTSKALEIVPVLADQADQNDQEFFGILGKEEEKNLKEIVCKLLKNINIPVSENWRKK
jgi:DNA-binding MarR family transcriptional regulator